MAEELAAGDEEVAAGDEEAADGDEEVADGDEEAVAGDEVVAAGDEVEVAGAAWLDACAAPVALREAPAEGGGPAAGWLDCAAPAEPAAEWAAPAADFCALPDAG